jgi:hypothetical protein
MSEQRMSVTFTVRSATGRAIDRIEVEPRHLILGGFSARSEADRERHIAELRQIGIEPPAQTPAFWHVSTNLLTTGSEVEVQGDATSGEVEYALVAHAGRTYVTVASDQTDRELERTSIPRSKQLCAKVLGLAVVPLDGLREVWDEVELTSEVSANGSNWQLYQRSPLAALLDPDALIHASGLGDGLPDGTVFLSGTVPLVDGVTRFAPHFRAALTIPDGGPTLRLAYRVDVLPEIGP